MWYRLPPTTSAYGIIGSCMTVKQFEVPVPSSVEAIGFDRSMPLKLKAKVPLRHSVPIFPACGPSSAATANRTLTLVCNQTYSPGLALLFLLARPFSARSCRGG